MTRRLLDHYLARRRHWAAACDLDPATEPPTITRVDESRAAAACQRAGLLADQVAGLTADLGRVRGTLGRVCGRRDELARALADADRSLLWADRRLWAAAAEASALSARLRAVIDDHPGLRDDGRLVDVLHRLADLALGHGPVLSVVRDKVGRALVPPAPTEESPPCATS